MEKPSKMRIARIAAGMTLADVARRMGVSKATVHNWEQEKRGMQPATRQALARMYRVPLSKISVDKVHAGR